MGSLVVATSLAATISDVSGVDLTVESIVANSEVGDGQREVTSFVITVNDSALLSGLDASDFDIVNNVDSIPVDVATNALAQDYGDDGISLEVTGNTITMNVTPFDYTGKYKSDFSGRIPWEVICTTYPELSFQATDVTQLKTKTLDDTLRGEFTYAGITREYALYLPTDGNGNVKKDVPLVVWNHGGGEYAKDLEDTLVANRGLTAWVEAGYETAVLQMQVSNPNYSFMWFDDEQTRIAKQKLIDQNNALQIALIKSLIEQGTIDQDQVYVTGASSGGGATMRMVMQEPELFAGAIAICSMDPIFPVHHQPTPYQDIVAGFEAAFAGAVYTFDGSTMSEKQVDTQALLDLPIYYVHAQNDTTCNVFSSQAMYEAMSNMGDTNNEITIYTNDQMAQDGLAEMLLHWSWVKVLNHNEDKTPMNWLFNQAKEAVATNQPVDQPDEDQTATQPETTNQNETPAPESQASPETQDDQVIIETGDTKTTIGLATMLAAALAMLFHVLKKPKATN